VAILSLGQASQAAISAFYRRMSSKRIGRLVSRQLSPRAPLPTRTICSTCLRYSEAKPAESATEPEPEAEDDGAMTRRLRSLAEEAEGIPAHFNTKPDPSSTITDADLLKLQDRIAQASFNASYPRAQAEHDLPKTADKLTRQIASDQPWTGEETTPDAVLRMLTDVHKPLKMPVGKPSLSQLPLKGPKKPTTPRSPGGRVLAAKEASQGYTLLKEKFSPGFRAMPATMEGLASLAEERIQNARMRGEFNHLPGRGKPMTKDHLRDSAYIDRTGWTICLKLMIEYFLNRILQRQGAAPPWIQAQVDLVGAFNTFRESIRTEWLRHITRQISLAPGSISSHIATAQSFVSRDIAANYTLREYKAEWEAREEKYHELAVEDLNAKTRSYNTIAPYSARKAYTTLPKELEDCYRDVAPKIVDTIRASRTMSAPANAKSSGGAFAVFERV
jgi:hypothetical protein